MIEATICCRTALMPVRIGGQLGSLRLPRKNLLLDLGGQHRPVSHHGQHPVNHEHGIRRNRCAVLGRKPAGPG